MCNCVVEGGVVMKKRGGGLVNKPMWWGGLIQLSGYMEGGLNK